MAIKIFYTIALFGMFVSSALSAQETKQLNLDQVKIRGTRFIPYPNFSGKPYLNDKFILGEIELNDGTKIGNIGLSYSTYRDELIYYNTAVSAQILIDKISLKGFSLMDPRGEKRIFRRQYYDGSIHDNCYFELLSDGKFSLLAYRKVNLEPCDTYYTKSGLSYQPAWCYYIYSVGKGYSQVNISRNSLLSKFSKQNQKLIRKLLRKNGIFIADESEFTKAWNLIVENGFEPIFN